MKSTRFVVRAFDTYSNPGALEESWLKPTMLKFHRLVLRKPDTVEPVLMEEYPDLSIYKIVWSGGEAFVIYLAEDENTPLGFFEQDKINSNQELYAFFNPRKVRRPHMMLHPVLRGRGLIQSLHKLFLSKGGTFISDGSTEAVAKIWKSLPFKLIAWDQPSKQFTLPTKENFAKPGVWKVLLGTGAYADNITR